LGGDEKRPRDARVQKDNTFSVKSRRKKSLTTFSVSSYSINDLITFGATSRTESRKRQEKRRNVNALKTTKENRKNRGWGHKSNKKRQKRMTARKGGQEKRRNVNALNDMKGNRKNGELSPLQSNKLRIDGSHTYSLQKKNPQG
jgi:hypothetical protein